MVQRKLPGTQIVLDALFKKMVGRAQQHDALRQMGETRPNSAGAWAVPMTCSNSPPVAAWLKKSG